MVKVKYSTRFFCPLCKRVDGRNQMLYLDEEVNLLRCERHTSFMKECSCRAKDMIVFETYPDTEEESEQMVNSLNDSNEQKAKQDQEDKLEYEYAMAINEASGDDFVEGFDFSEGA